MRAHLKHQLPGVHGAWMRWCSCSVLPLTPSGKIDRKALPAPEGRPQIGGYVAPRTPLEQTLARIWAEVLHLEQVGVEDNFFELGGHSLLVMRMVAQVREVLQIEHAVRAVFEAPTVAELAQHVEALRRGGGWVLPALGVQVRPQFLPLSHAQERLWFLEQLGLMGAAYNVPTVLRMRGVLDLPALQLSIGELIRRHESLRTRFTVHDGEAAQIIDAAGAFQLPLLDLSGLEEAQREGALYQQIETESAQRLDLALVPLCRARVLRVDEKEQCCS